jgi:DNA polymerase-3 subunit gamma/tau
MGKALYRKYRPISLATVVGQDSVTVPLAEAIKTGTFSHAYIFTGPRGCGITSVARIFAHEVNGFKYELEDSYPDIIEIDGASNTGIDDIRELREKAMIAPTEGKYKVYIIDEVHMLSKNAFNGLLKIIEEPPEHVIFILATTNLEKVPITITSRSQIFHFNLADKETMISHLKNIVEKEKLGVEDEALKVIVERGGGSFRDSISLLDQVSNLKKKGEKITKKDIDLALGIPEDEKIETLLKNFEEGTETTEILKDILNSGSSAESIAKDLIDKIIEHPTAKTLNLIEKLFNVQYPFADAKLLVAFLESEKFQPVVATPQVVLAAAPTVDSKKQAEFLKRVEQSKAEMRRRIEESKEEKVELKATSLADSVVQGGTLNIEAFVKDVKNTHRGLGNTLENCGFILEKEELKVYPPKKLVDIFKKPNNLRLLKSTAPGFFINIIDTAEEKIPENAIYLKKKEEKKPVSEKMQKKINAISDIMGEDIKEDEDAPF